MTRFIDLGSDQVWIWRGQVAVVLGTVVFLVLLVPIVAWQYRRFGSLNLRRLAGAGAASLYLTALVSYTALPLPKPEDVECRTSSREAFHFIGDIEGADIGPGLLGLLSNRTVLQVLLNVVFFIPWGIGVRGFLGRSIVTATLSGLAVSTFIELTQGTSLWFNYPCPYRTGDVDDVILNTAGAFIGAVIAPLVLWWMPRGADLAQTRLVPRPISVWRRWVAMFIEFGVLYLIVAILLLLARAIPEVLRIDLSDPVIGWTRPVSVIVAWSVVFAIPALRGFGSTGMRSVWIKPVWPKAGISLVLIRLARASVVSGPWLANELHPAAWTTTLTWTAAVIAVLSVPLTRDHRGATCWITGARLVDTRSEADGLPPASPDRMLGLAHAR